MGLVPGLEPGPGSSPARLPGSDAVGTSAAEIAALSGTLATTPALAGVPSVLIVTTGPLAATWRSMSGVASGRNSKLASTTSTNAPGDSASTSASTSAFSSDCTASASSMRTSNKSEALVSSLPPPFTAAGSIDALVSPPPAAPACAAPAPLASTTFVGEPTAVPPAEEKRLPNAAISPDNTGISTAEGTSPFAPLACTCTGIPTAWGMGSRVAEPETEPLGSGPRSGPGASPNLAF